MICGFCFIVELIQIWKKNTIAGWEKYLELACQAIKLKSTARSRKTQSLFNKKGHEEKENLFLEVVLCCCAKFYPRCNKLCTFTYSLSSLFCAQDALLALLTHHESVRLTQRSSGVPICYSGTWAQMRHQQLHHHVLLYLRPWQHHLKHGLCLASLLKQMGLDRLLPHPGKVSFITVIYQKHCCASALLFMCLQREVSNHPKERPTSNNLS